MRKVYVIAGHNGKGTGACGFIDEGVETLELRFMVCRHLKSWGIPFNTDPDELNLTSVVSWLKKLVHKTDIVVDLHFNAANKKARGVEVLVSSAGDIERPMANEICERIADILGTPNRGVKGEASGHHSKLAMLSNFEAEQMIVEVCFCDNQADAAAYTAKKWLVAKAIAEVISKYAIL